MIKKILKSLLPITVCAVAPISCVACSNKLEIQLDYSAWQERMQSRPFLTHILDEIVNGNLNVYFRMYGEPYREEYFPIIQKVVYHIKYEDESSWIETDKFNHKLLEGKQEFEFCVDIYYNQIVQELQPKQKIDGFKLYFA